VGVVVGVAVGVAVDVAVDVVVDFEVDVAVEVVGADFVALDLEDPVVAVVFSVMTFLDQDNPKCNF